MKIAAPYGRAEKSKHVKVLIKTYARALQPADKTHIPMLIVIQKVVLTMEKVNETVEAEEKNMKHDIDDMNEKTVEMVK